MRDGLKRQSCGERPSDYSVTTSEPSAAQAKTTLSLPTARDLRASLLETFALGLLDAEHPDDREFGEAIMWLLKSEDALYCTVRHLCSHTLTPGDLHRRATAARAIAELRE